jgi:AraC-like DNA-binding protein
MKHPLTLNAARAFIEAHFDEPVTLAQLAELSALSVSRFATVFRQQYGSSPYRYLCGLRIQRAQTLLLEGVPGSVVATEVGFFDQSHFGRHFKRCCGMTPSMFIERERRQGMKGLGVTPATQEVNTPTFRFATLAARADAAEVEARAA